MGYKNGTKSRQLNMLSVNNLHKNLCTASQGNNPTRTVILVDQILRQTQQTLTGPSF